MSAATKACHRHARHSSAHLILVFVKRGAVDVLVACAQRSGHGGAHLTLVRLPAVQIAVQRLVDGLGKNSKRHLIPKRQ